MASLRDTALPAQGNTAWYAHYQAVDEDARRGANDSFHLDEFTGTDDQKLTSAISAQQAATARNMPPIVLPSRPISFTTPRTLYSGCKIVPPWVTGQKNGELAGGNYVGAEITLGGSVTSGTASWWNGTGDIYDVFMSGFTVQGNQGSSVHQFLDQPSGTLYACEFNSLAFNFMRGVFGRSDRKCLMTQVALTGSWTINNAWDTQIHAGGSDCIWWMDSFANIGVSQSASQTGTLSTYFMKLDSLELMMGKVYISAMNGWRGILISGGGSMVDMHGSIIEGYKPTRVNGLLAGPGPGSLVKITDGAVSMYGCKIGQGMDNPDVTEDGLVWISGGEVSMFGVNFYGRNMTTENAVQHTGGRLYMAGITKRQNEGAYWTNRPNVLTTATAGTGAYTFTCPDQSITDV